MEGTAHVIELLGSLVKALQQQAAEQADALKKLTEERDELLAKWRAGTPAGDSSDQ